jgi:RHS repeat-associated protein
VSRDQLEELFNPLGVPWTAGSWVDLTYAGLNPYDLNTGLNRAANRLQSPNLGRWLSPDPLGGDITSPQSLNRYAYALNNPETLTDPSGLWPRDECPGPAAWGCDAIRHGVGGSLFQDPFSLIGIPVVVWGYGWIAVQGSGFPGPSFSGSVGGGDFSATSYLNVTAYWGPTTLGYAGDAFGLWGGAFTPPVPLEPSSTRSNFSWRGTGANSGKPLAPILQQPQKEPCTPLANSLQGTPVAGLDTLVDAFNRLTHPLELLALNGIMFATGAVTAATGGAAVAITSGMPEPLEPLACVAGVAGGVPTAAGGVFLMKQGVNFFKNVTLPAIIDWGCHE